MPFLPLSQYNIDLWLNKSLQICFLKPHLLTDNRNLSIDSRSCFHQLPVYVLPVSLSLRRPLKIPNIISNYAFYWLEYCSLSLISQWVSACNTQIIRRVFVIVSYCVWTWDRLTRKHVGRVVWRYPVCSLYGEPITPGVSPLWWSESAVAWTKVRRFDV